MRPLCLTMTAFGPYAQQQKLDFKELQERTFFLIHGPTGSGKTTILDGMCFAFFGDASGVQRDSKSMRSDHADAAVITEVIFDFAIGQACYRVKRIPEQERPKRRGEGTTTMAAQAELWSIPKAEEPVLLATKWLEVTKQIEVLLGFKSSQFRQVVLLPQGEFRKLLTANSAERQEIMQTLFKTDLYCRIEEKLKEDAQRLKRSNEDLTKERQWILQEAGVAEEPELLKHVQENEKEAEHLAAQMKLVSEELELAQQAVTQGVAIQEKIKAKKTAEEIFAELVQQKSAVEQERVSLVRAAEAASLLDAEKNVANYAQDVQALEKSCKVYKQELDITNQNVREAQQLFEIEAANEAARERLAREIINLQQMEDKIKIFQEALETASTYRNTLSQALQKKQQAELRCTKTQAQMDHVVIDQQQYLQLALEAGSRQAQWQSGQHLLTKRRQLEEYRQMATKLEQQVVASQLQLAGVEKDYEEIKGRNIKLQHDWVQGQAAFMASNLIQGTGCPVCGSTHHPKPAALVGQVPDERQMKTAQKMLEAMEQKKEKLRNEHSSLQTEWNLWDKRITDLLEELKEQKGVSLTEFSNEVHRLQERYEEALTGEKQAKELTQRLGELTKDQEKNHKELAQVEEAWRQADQLLKAAETIVQERRLAIPKELQEQGQLAATLKDAQNNYEQAKIAWEFAQHNVQQKKQLVIKQQTLLENAQTRLIEYKGKYQEEQKYFLKRILASGFMDEHDYQKAKKSQDVMNAAAKRIAAFDSEFSKAELFLEQAVAVAAGLELPDILYLQQVAADRQNKYKAMFTAHTNLEAQIRQQQTSLKKIVQLLEKRKTLEAQYAVVGRLAEVANGGNEHKLTLQRFVLGTLLENVIAAANGRLKMMSRNRYSLQRTLDRARKNAAGGLDLEVFDNYTGIARGVGTLSGGETFLASLSLALGLADVVQSYAGGIHLDTILVDEGFGTLDPESLDFAIKALIDLQQGGRLVGIISHVPELKERIDARLEVMATERGSKAYFKIG
jgi:exonuclease SbcC